MSRNRLVDVLVWRDECSEVLMIEDDPEFAELYRLRLQGDDSVVTAPRLSAVLARAVAGPP